MDKKIQLFLLPYAGGSSFSFMKLVRFIDREIECIPLEYSGHGVRENEPIIQDYELFINDICQQINRKRNTELPYVFFGYSLGSAIAFDIGCGKDIIGGEPFYCFLCAEGGLIHDNPARAGSRLDNEEFEKLLINMGGIDQRVKNAPSVFEKKIRLIKCDFNILNQYMYCQQKLKCDCTIIYSPSDTTCVNMDDWHFSCEGNTEYIEIGDDHFFINKMYKEVAAIINGKLKSLSYS